MPEPDIALFGVDWRAAPGGYHDAVSWLVWRNRDHE